MRRLTCILLACCATPALAEFMAVGEPVPVDRLIANIQRHIDQKPDDSHGWFVLARVHALGYARDGGQVRVVDKEGSLPEFAPYDNVRVGRRPDAELSDAARDHLGKSITAYRKAIELDPKIAIYHLGLGWMLEQQALRATNQPADAVVNIEREAVEHYVRAIDLALKQDLKRHHIMMGTDDAVSYEAAENAHRLLTSGRIDDPKRLKQVDAAREKLMRLPMAITPIVFPLDRPRPLSDLVNNAARVSFDLAGLGRSDQRWPWVTGNAGILVWDPQQTGAIVSGRQLFGSSTFSMFWRDGYQPLAMLDDDGDGTLTGSELAGVAVWHDVNGNAVSDPGEVVSAESFGIAAIETRSTGESTPILSNLHGVRLRDGGTLPTYDWMPLSHPAAAPLSAAAD